MADNLTPKQLQLFTKRGDAVATQAAEETVKAIRKFFNRYLENVKANVAGFALSGESDTIDLAEQNEIIKTLRTSLDNMGYQEVLEQFDKGLHEVGKESLEYFNEAFAETRTLGGLPAGAVDLMASDLREELNLMVDQKLIRPLETTIRNSTLGTATRQEMARDVLNVIDSGGILRKDGKEFTNINIEVMIDDAGRQFQELVRSEKAKELGLEIFVYRGPLDKVTSSQCIALLTIDLNGAPGFYYRDQITADLHENLRGNPLINRGHPNCRHAWFPVSERYAKANSMTLREAEE